VFLDRDGTIAEEVGDLNHIERFRMFPFTGPAVRRLNQAGFAVIVVTNQPGIARGFFPERLVQEVSQRIHRELRALDAQVDAVYYCPHTSADNCECRKPRTGMLERAAREHRLIVPGSFVVGDRYSDVELAFQARCKSVFVRTGYGRGEEAWHGKDWPRQPDAIVDDLAQAVNWILGQPR
jgi:D-glycero-D-manno-heptose 1,7-bisphosphate phosphatase